MTALPLCVAAAAFIIAVGLPSSDPDMWWHLASGRWMIEHGEVLKVDIFSSTATGRRSGSGWGRWRREFAREDWKVALDLELAQRVELRYLDTKYILDPEGTIRNIDVAVADERYLALIREIVQERR